VSANVHPNEAVPVIVTGSSNGGQGLWAGLRHMNGGAPIAPLTDVG
jgi:hypothetical protein